MIWFITWLIPVSIKGKQFPIWQTNSRTETLVSQDKLRAASVQKTNMIHLAVLTEHQLVTDSWRDIGWTACNELAQWHMVKMWPERLKSLVSAICVMCKSQKFTFGRRLTWRNSVKLGRLNKIIPNLTLWNSKYASFLLQSISLKLCHGNSQLISVTEWICHTSAVKATLH